MLLCGTMSRLQYMNLKSIFSKVTLVQKLRTPARLIASSRYYSKLSSWGTKKSATHVKITYYPEGMADPKVEEILAPLRAAVKKQVNTNISCS